MSCNAGVKPDRPGLNGSGIDIDAVPAAALTDNFSPSPRLAPPPFGTDTDGSRSAVRCRVSTTGASLCAVEAPLLVPPFSYRRDESARNAEVEADCRPFGEAPKRRMSSWSAKRETFPKMLRTIGIRPSTRCAHWIHDKGPERG